MTLVIDGKKISQQIKDEVKEKVIDNHMPCSDSGRK